MGTLNLRLFSTFEYKYEAGQFLGSNWRKSRLENKSQSIPQNRLFSLVVRSSEILFGVKAVIY